MDKISTNKAPTPGVYSQAVRVPAGHDLIFISGQTANAPDGKDEPVVKGGMAEQTTRVLDNLLAIVTAAGGKVTDFVSMTVYLRDPGDASRQAAQREEFNQAYAKFFAAFGITREERVLPARAQVWVSEIPLVEEDTMIEIQAVAAVRPPRSLMEPQA